MFSSSSYTHFNYFLFIYFFFFVSWPCCLYFNYLLVQFQLLSFFYHNHGQPNSERFQFPITKWRPIFTYPQFLLSKEVTLENIHRNRNTHLHQRIATPAVSFIFIYSFDASWYVIGSEISSQKTRTPSLCRHLSRFSHITLFYRFFRYYEQSGSTKRYSSLPILISVTGADFRV